MRFDDRFETVLRQPASPESAAGLWTQLVDLLAQGGGRIDPDRRKFALERLKTLQSEVPADRRRAAATAIASRCRSADLVTLFAKDELRVGGSVLLGALIAPADWIALLPELSPPARSLLRGRRDLAAEVRRALLAFGEQDFVLGDANSDRMTVEASLPTQAIPISALVERIERWRQDRPTAPQPVREAPSVAPVRFKTDAAGTIVWQQGGNAEALIGAALAEFAPPGDYGVDGQTVGAFTKRATIENGRLALPDGDWTIAATPRFEGETGRFTGYLGTLRRAAARPVASFGLPPDAARQAVHELGTPLNAIRGFSEMIAGEMLGPVSGGHRDRARAIVADSRRLAVVVDEIDTAAKIEGRSVSNSLRDDGGSTVSGLLARIGEDLDSIGQVRDLSVAIEAANDAPALRGNEAELERLIRRFVVALTGIADRGTSVTIATASESGAVRLSVGLPRDLHGGGGDLSNATLSADDSNPDAPPLGLGYTLRLITAMARKIGGRLEIGHDSCGLIIPAHSDSGTAAIEGV